MNKLLKYIIYFMLGIIIYYFLFNKEDKLIEGHCGDGGEEECTMDPDNQCGVTAFNCHEAWVISAYENPLKSDDPRPPPNLLMVSKNTKVKLIHSVELGDPSTEPSEFELDHEQFPMYDVWVADATMGIFHPGETHIWPARKCNLTMIQPSDEDSPPGCDDHQNLPPLGPSAAGTDLNTGGSPPIPLGYDFFKPDKSDWSDNSPIKVSFKAITDYAESTPKSLFDNVIDHITQSIRKEIKLYPHSFDDQYEGEGITYYEKIKILLAKLPYNMEREALDEIAGGVLELDIFGEPRAARPENFGSTTGNIFINDNLDYEILIISFHSPPTDMGGDPATFSMNLIYIFNNNNDPGKFGYNDFFTLNLDNINNTTIDINTIYNGETIPDIQGNDNPTYISSIHLPRFDANHYQSAVNRNDAAENNFDTSMEEISTQLNVIDPSLPSKPLGDILEDYEGLSMFVIDYIASSDGETTASLAIPQIGYSRDKYPSEQQINTDDYGIFTDSKHPGIAGYNLRWNGCDCTPTSTIQWFDQGGNSGKAGESRSSSRVPVINYKIRSNPGFEKFIQTKKFTGLDPFDTKFAPRPPDWQTVGANREWYNQSKWTTRTYKERTTEEKTALNKLNLFTFTKIKQLQSAIDLNIEVYHIEIIEKKAAESSLMLLLRLLGSNSATTSDTGIKIDYGDISTGCSDYHCENNNLSYFDNWVKKMNPKSDLFLQCNNELRDSIASLISPGSRCSKEICCDNMTCGEFGGLKNEDCQTYGATDSNPTPRPFSRVFHGRKCYGTYCNNPSHCCTPGIKPSLISVYDSINTFKGFRSDESLCDSNSKNYKISNIDIKYYILHYLLGNFNGIVIDNEDKYSSTHEDLIDATSDDIPDKDINKLNILLKKIRGLDVEEPTHLDKIILSPNIHEKYNETDFPWIEGGIYSKHDMWVKMISTLNMNDRRGEIQIVQNDIKKFLILYDKPLIGSDLSPLDISLGVTDRNVELCIDIQILRNLF